MQQTFEVGDSLYILSKKGIMNVVPAIVVEIVSKKTISGSNVSYKVLASTAKGNMTFDLSKLEEGESGDIFTNQSSIREEIENRAQAMIDETLAKLNSSITLLMEECNLTQKPNNFAPEPEQPKIPRQVVEDLETDYIMLPDGQKVKAKFRNLT